MIESAFCSLLSAANSRESFNANFLLVRLDKRGTKFSERIRLFTYEVENNDKLPFLDILVIREDNEFTTNIYSKPTFSGLYTNFHRFFFAGIL